MRMSAFWGLNKEGIITLLAEDGVFQIIFRARRRDAELYHYGGAEVNDNRKTSLWIHCPICGGKTRTKVYEDTVLVKFPLYCPKCKQETLIEAKGLHIAVIKEPDAQTQSR